MGLKVANNIFDLIGGTPIIRINKLIGPEDAELYVKLEWYNIGGSVKDRMAYYIIQYAEASGVLKKDKIILEATSGNTGIALAMICAFKGYRLTLIMPENVSVERRKIIEAYGAQLILSPGEKGTGGAIELKEKLLREHPEKYVNVDQFSDPANILAHYETTGKEILEQTGGKVNIIVVGIGTAGTGVGTSIRVKEFNKNIKVVGVIPKVGFTIQGLRNPNEPHPTKLFRREWFDKIVEIDPSEKENIFEVARKMARMEGILIGLSSAAIMYTALMEARDAGKGKMVVAVLPDNGLKYLSTDLFH